jgi:hypothetical protein
MAVSGIVLFCVYVPFGCALFDVLIATFKFEARSGFLIYVADSSGYLCGFVEIIRPSSVEVLSERCFSECKSLSSVTFESGSKLSRIEKNAFAGTGLIDIIIPASVDFLGEGCFADINSLSSVAFESESRLSRIEKPAFRETGLVEIVLP